MSTASPLPSPFSLTFLLLLLLLLLTYVATYSTFPSLRHLRLKKGKKSEKKDEKKKRVLAENKREVPSKMRGWDKRVFTKKIKKRVK